MRYTRTATIVLLMILACGYRGAASKVKELEPNSSHHHLEATLNKNSDFYCPWLYMFYAQKAPP